MFLIWHVMLEAMPEQVGGKVTMGWPRQNESLGSQALPETRRLLGWLSL